VRRTGRIGERGKLDEAFTGGRGRVGRIRAEADEAVDVFIVCRAG
jgi:hypothetical protein